MNKSKKVVLRPGDNIFVVYPPKESRLLCECGASCENTSKYRNRFKRRHPATPEHLAEVKAKKQRLAEAAGKPVVVHINPKLVNIGF
jgi:acetone carboxylase gamma subunit